MNLFQATSTLLSNNKSTKYFLRGVRLNRILQLQSTKNTKCVKNTGKRFLHDDATWQSLPRQTKKIFMPSSSKNYDKTKRSIRSRLLKNSNVANSKGMDNAIAAVNFKDKSEEFEKKLKKIESPLFESRIKARVNEFGIQMLSKSLYEHIFKGYHPKSDEVATTNKTSNVDTKKSLIEDCKKILINHGMVSTESDFTKEVDFKVPELKGENLEEHFLIIGEEQAKPYRDIVEKILQKLPEKPKTWVFQEGWTRYIEGEAPEKVPYPLEDGLIFDVETCVTASQAPVLATAVSTKAWYGWVSKTLVEESSYPVTNEQYSLDVLIPLEPENFKSCTNKNKNNQGTTNPPKIVVGHNVSFDRARIKEQYYLTPTKTRFLDTMSLHICISGLTSYQRALLRSKKSAEPEEEQETDNWKRYSSLNSLSEVHKLYCGTPIEKQTRDMFVEGTIKEIKENFNEGMSYCARDVEATYEVLKEIFPIFLERFPHPITFAGMLELGMGILPVNSNWWRYISTSEQTYEDFDIESKLLLARKADQACQLLHNEKYKEDVWMWDQDWEVKEIKIKTPKVQIRKTETKTKSKENDLENKSENHILETKSKTKHKEGEETLTDNSEEIDENSILHQKFSNLFNENSLPAKIPLLPGYPNWYRKLCTKANSFPEWVPSPHLISTSMQITPKLLSLMWEGYPLHYIRGQGWGFLVPFTDDLEIDRKVPLKNLISKCPIQSHKNPNTPSTDLSGVYNQIEQNLCSKQYPLKPATKTGKPDYVFYQGSGVWCDVTIEDCCWFLKLPHKNGPSHRVGNPLAKDFLNKFSENVLSGDTEGAEKVLAIARQLSYWRNNRDRIMDQMVVRLPEFGTKKPTKNISSKPPAGTNSQLVNTNLSLSNKKFSSTANQTSTTETGSDLIGTIIPQVVVSGTLTRRAVEPTWMTASNASTERIGSELRAMVQAPPGYYFVGADVDSQELWIASVIGDAYHAKIHGCTPLGWMTLSGTKSASTDMHSVTAKTVGISREHAKVINYARIYGAGQKFAERLLKQFNPAISESEARNKATKMFNFTKGKQLFKLRSKYSANFEQQHFTKYQAFELAKLHGVPVSDMFEKPTWVNGTESAMFNRLEEIANSKTPRTPFLDCRLSRALEPQLVQSDQFLPTRINWVVQSGAVDFLHLMMVCMRWLLKDKIRFSLSFHDEVRYLVKEEDRYQAALAMHISNLLTRSFCCVKLGLNDLPQSVAFFSSVEVDKVLRKDASHDYVTPSNPFGLTKGYKVPFGESLDIYEAVKKSGGKFVHSE